MGASSSERDEVSCVRVPARRHADLLLDTTRDRRRYFYESKSGGATMCRAQASDCCLRFYRLISNMTAPSFLLRIRSFMSKEIQERGVHLLGRLRNVALLFRIIGGACRYFAGKDGQLHTSAPPKYCATVMARSLLGVEAWQLSVRPRLLDEWIACGGLVPTGACYLLYLRRRCSVQLAFPSLFSRSLM